VLKEKPPLVGLKTMPTCRTCNQTYDESQFIGGIGPRHLICARCGVEAGLVDANEAPQYFSDEVAKARISLFSKRYRLPMFTGAGWILFLTLGRGIELWSSIFLGVLVISTLAAPVLHFLGSTRFKADLSRLSP
jgi:hypothetical protein